MGILDRLSLHGKTALVTGGGTGLGQAMALAMADAGADVAVSGRRLPPLEETRRLIEAKGRRSFAISTDVTDEAQVAAMIAGTIEALGRLDILVNNAGGGGAGRGKEFPDLTLDDWHEGMDGNLTSMFLCCRAIVPHFLERGGGRVINTVSPSGMRGRRGDFMYGIAKAGTVQFTRAFAMTYARDHIRCTGIAPGAFPHFLAPGVPNPRGEAQAAGRTGIDYEIGPLAVFLASEASDYLSGACYLIDGGSTSAGVLPAGLVPLAEG
jgi:NAD(P)-dependent dehydrogenase (short-subunit alcohol dehydrogenase family)